MPIFFPDSRRSRVIFASRAEQRFYEALRQQLSDQWQVYYSITLSKLEDGRGIVGNEADFVLYHPKWGLIVLEVKGGRIQFDADTGQFFSTNRHDQKFKIKNPFQQALTWKARFLRFAKNEGIKCPMSHGVVFPDALESEFPVSSELEPKLILGVQKLQNVESALRELVKVSQPEKFLNFSDVGQELDKLLRGASFHTAFKLRDYIDSHDLRVIDLETIQETLVLPITQTKRMAVEGEAGTGKTLLASMLATHFRNCGARVLFLSSNPFLVNELQKKLGDGIEVSTYVKFSSDHGVDLLRPPKDYKEGKKQDWVQFEAPERLKQTFLSQKISYDVLLCDEAQDVQPFWWEAFEQLAPKSDNKNLYLFFDRSQGVFGSGGDSDGFMPEEVLPVGKPYFCLLQNYRTTREIADFSRFFRTGQEVFSSHSARLGRKPRLIVYKDEKDAQAQLEQLITSLMDTEGVRGDEIKLLSARSPFGNGSFLEGVSHVGRLKIGEMGKSQGDLMATTIGRFKGLETPIGVICNLSEYNLPLDHPLMSSLFYVAATRAKHMLFIMCREGDSKQKVLEQRLSQVEEVGSFALGGSSTEQVHLASGIVSHYNPHRLGLIKVQDPGIEISKVLLFPSDVTEAGLKELKVGSRVRFRLCQEANITYAGNLELIS